MKGRKRVNECYGVKWRRQTMLHFTLCFVALSHFIMSCVMSVASTNGLQLDILSILDDVNETSIEVPSTYDATVNQNKNFSNNDNEVRVIESDDDNVYQEEYDLDDFTTSRVPEELERRREIYLRAFPRNDHSITTLKDLEDRIYSHEGDDSVNRKVKSIPTPRDLNILFMGDSLSRFQYLDLAYFLTHGTWNDEHITSNMNANRSSMVTDHKYDRWIDFFQHTNSELQPYEQCDCYRKTSGSIVGGEGIIENRYFRDEYKNNTVTYLQKFGDYPFKSSWDVSDVHRKHGKMITRESQLKPLFWIGWVDAIQSFVCQMNPKPSVFIFNQGWWTNNDLVNVTLQSEILDALRSCDIISIYRTTNKGRDETDRNIDEYESQLCDAADYCMNMTWTAVVPESHYVDRNHFQPPVYTWMNLELLSILAGISAVKM